MDIHNPQKPAVSNLQQWLRSDACYPVLEGAARSVLEWAWKARLPDDVLLIEKGSDRSEQLQSVTAFMWDVLNDPSRLENCRAQLADVLADDDMNSFRSILISRIINHCKDEHRKEQNSPFHYFYRRMSSTLSQAEEIQYDYTEGRAYYAISTADDLDRIFEDYFSRDDFRGWPHPGFPHKDIVKAVVHLGIARIFWDTALDVLEKDGKGEHLLPIKDLVGYVDRMYGLSSLITTGKTADSDGGDELPSPAESIHDPGSHAPETNVLHQELIADAARLVSSWKPKTRICFYLLRQGMPMREIAEIVDLGSAQAVAPHKEKAFNSIQEYFRQWALSGPIDSDPDEDRKVFLEAISDFILKNHPECRAVGKGAHDTDE
ncbi:MAG: hypothetical protein WCP10_15150 [Desulfuromonadales bacterium]